MANDLQKISTVGKIQIKKAKRNPANPKPMYTLIAEKEYDSNTKVGVA